MSERHKFYGKYRGTVVNNIDPMQIGRIQVQRAGRRRPDPDELGDALRAGRRHPERHVHACRRSAPACGSSSSRATPTTRSGSAASGAARPRCRRWRTRRRRACQAITLQTPLQNGLTVSDLPGPTGGIMLKSATGATLIVNDTGIYIQNGKGATIVMTGPTVTINNGALTVV